MQEAPPPAAPRRGFSPALLLLIFPIIGLIAAGVVILTSQPSALPRAATPAPVTLPPSPPTSNPFTGGRIDFTLPALEGGEVALAEYEGQPVILNFWATWCVPCERELPAIARFLELSDIPVLAINIGETADIVQPWLDERSLTTIPVLLDTELDVRNRYGVFSIPVTYGLDSAGVVQEQHFGELTLDNLEAMAAALAG